MPGMGGLKCLREIIKIDPGARIIVASGYSDEASVEEIISAGAKKFVNKPYSVNDMLMIVRKALSA